MKTPLVFVAALSFWTPVCSAGVAQNPRVGHIIGNIDGISHDGEQYFISGWACQKQRRESIDIHIYGNPSAGGATKRAFLTASQANFDSEPAVNLACNDEGGGKHRFFVALPFGYGAQSRLFVHGIRILEGVPNEAIAGSGQQLRQLDRLEMPFSTPAAPA